MQMTEINKELERVLDLLQLEKKEDFERFREKVMKLSIKEKREKGLTWHPVFLKKEGFTL